MLKRLFHKFIDSATRDLRDRLEHIEDKQNRIIRAMSEKIRGASSASLLYPQEI